MRVKLGSVAVLKAAGGGYGIGLDLRWVLAGFLALVAVAVARRSSTPPAGAAPPTPLPTVWRYDDWPGAR